MPLLSRNLKIRLIGGCTWTHFATQVAVDLIHKLIIVLFPVRLRWWLKTSLRAQRQQFGTLTPVTNTQLDRFLILSLN